MNAAVRSSGRFDINAAVEAALALDPTDPQTAESEFDRLNGRMNGLTAEKEGIELAISITLRGEHADASPSFLAKADPYKQLAEKYPKRAAARLDEIDEAIDDLRPKLDVARERRRLAREQNALRLAASLKPRHRKAVQAIGRALELLSAAVAAEQEMHREFQSEMPGFAVLLDFGNAWRGALLNDPRSAASAWARTAKSAGYIDE